MRNLKSINYIIALLFVAFFNVSSLQASLKSGDRNYKTFNWEKAIAAYERYDKRHPGNLEVIEKIASCYRMQNDWYNAEIWLAKLYASNEASKENIYHYGQALRANMKYDKALEVFTKYASLSASKTTKGLLVSEEEINQLMQKNDFTVTLSDINSKEADFAPFIKDNQLFFASDRLDDPKAIRYTDNWNHRNFLQIYMVNVDTVPSGDSVIILPVKGVNARFHDGPIAFHPSTGEMYFTRTNFIDHKLAKSVDDVAKVKVYKTPFDFSNLKSKGLVSEALRFNNDEYSVGHVSFNEDGSIIYFSSDMPGGYGATDLWMAKMDASGNYGMPINLGERINTEGNEMFPNFQNGKLYFASNGHQGLGGLDIFECSLEGDVWNNLVNLGFPINTNYDDFALVFQDENKGFFSSNRIGGIGDDDIYSFEKLGANLKVLVYDYDTKLPIEDAKLTTKSGTLLTDKLGVASFFGLRSELQEIAVEKPAYASMAFEYLEAGNEFDLKIPMYRNDIAKLIVQVLDKRTNEPLPNSDVTLNGVRALTDAEGFTFWEISPDKDYVLSAEKTINTEKKYLAQSTTFNTNGLVAPTTWDATILLDYYEVGKEVEINDIYYDLDKFFIRPDAACELSKLVNIMKDNPGIIIEMCSHTDCRASMAYNQTLSENRAKAAMEYLVRNGIDPNRLSYKGYGETKLTNSCACECDQAISVIGLKAFRKCEDAQVANCTEDDHQANRRTTFKIIKF